MSVIDWLLEGDPAIRWQVLRDLTDAPAGDVAAERARAEHDGWDARLLEHEGPDGLWDGGTCFPASYTSDEPGQPWTPTIALRAPAMSLTAPDDEVVAAVAHVAQVDE